MSLDFADLLLEVIERNASDLHLTAGAHPTVRVRGRLQPLEDYPVLTTEQTRETIYSILPMISASAWRRTGRSTSPMRSRGGRASVSTRTTSARRSRRPSAWEHRMQTMDAALATLVRAGKISQKLAEARSSTPEELRRLMGASSFAA